MEVFFLILEYTGIIAFAVSGAMVAIDKEADFVGVIIMALITTFMGGVFRDIMLGQFPPRVFTDYHIELLVAVATAIAVFAFAAGFKGAYVKEEAKINSIINIFDAVGLGIFGVYSTNIAIESGHPEPLVAISAGVIGCTLGGLTRDIVLGNIPFFLRKHIYIIAAVVGASGYYVLHMVFSANVAVSMLVGFALTFALRIFATVFKWNMPRAINFSRLTEEPPSEDASQKSEEDEKLPEKNIF